MSLFWSHLIILIVESGSKYWKIFQKQREHKPIVFGQQSKEKHWIFDQIMLDRVPKIVGLFKDFQK